MSLWRPCGRVIRVFAKLHVGRQDASFRGVERFTRLRGYVTVAPKPGNSITSSDEKFGAPGISALTMTSDEQSEAPSATTDNRSYFYGRDRNVRDMLAFLRRSLACGKLQNHEVRHLLESYARDLEGGSQRLLHAYAFSMPKTANPERRRLIARYIWDIVRRNKSALTLEDYNTMLSIHEYNKEPLEPLQFLDDMSVEPDATTYRLLMRIAASSGNVESALQLLSRMKNAGLPLEEDMLNLLIVTHATNGDVQSILSTLEVMRNAKIEPSVETWAGVAYGYASAGDYPNTVKILNDYNLDQAHILEIARRLSSSGLGENIPDVMKHISTPVDINDLTLIKTLMELVYDGRLQDAFAVLNCAVAPITDDLMNSVLKSFCMSIVKAQTPDGEILEMMNAIANAKNYPLAIPDVGEAAVRAGNIDLALAVFEAMRERRMDVRPHYYWPMLIRASETKGEPEVFRILQHMVRHDARPDFDTIYEYVMPYINTADPVITLRKFSCLGLEGTTVFTALMRYLISSRRLKEAVSLCQKIKLPLDFDNLLDALCTAVKNNDDDMKYAVMLLNHAPPGKSYPEQFLRMYGETSYGKNPQNLIAFDRAFRIHGSEFRGRETDEKNKSAVPLNKRLDSLVPDEWRPHPRDMNVEQLECHFIELKTKGMNVRGVLRKLLMFHCNSNNLSRALEIKNEIDERMIEWSPGMLSLLMDLYHRHEKLDESMDAYAKLLDHKDFTFDSFKIVRLATALVRANRIDEAFKILETTPNIKALRCDKACHELLDVVAHASCPAVTTRRMLDVLVKAGLCVRNKAMLGPLIRVHLVRSDLTSAVQTFATCAEQYGHAPLRQELVLALVKCINTDKSTKEKIMPLLNMVQSITQKIHGRTNVTLDLLAALARSGMTNELRKLLTSTEIPYNTLGNHLQMMPLDDRLTALTTLLEASTGVRNASRDCIYDLLLELHNERGDCEEALKLWNKWIEDDEASPSARFTMIVENLLKTHKVPLPENFHDQRFEK